MATGSWLLAFTAGVAVSLAASWLLVSRLERLGERAGFPEAWLGLLAAVAADDPRVVVAAKPAGRPLAGRARLRPDLARLRDRRAEIPAVRLHEPDGYERRSAASSGPSPEARRLPDR